MSGCSRALLATCCLGFAAGCIWCSFAFPAPQNHWFWLVLAGFLAIIAVTCIPGRHIAITSRLIALVVLAACVGYVVSEVIVPTKNTGPYRRSQTSLVNALIAFALFGVPSVYVLIKGRYPRWGYGGGALVEDDEAVEVVRR